MVVTNDDDANLRDTVWLSVGMAVSAIVIYHTGKLVGRITERVRQIQTENKED